MNYYQGKTILLTGATSGIGKALAIKLHIAGARLILLGRDFTALGNELPPEHGCTFYKPDFTKENEITAFAEEALAIGYAIDILIHSAGVSHLGRIGEMPVEKLDEQYLVNCRAPFLITQKFLPSLSQNKGQVIFLNSTAGLQTRELLGSYSCSKYALKAIADSLRMEVKSSGVSVMSVFLGATATPMQEKIQQYFGNVFLSENYMSAEDMAERILMVMLNGKVAGVTDVTIKGHNRIVKDINTS